MRDWKEIELKNVTDLITKGTTPTSVGGSFSDIGINFIKSECLNYEGIIEDDKFVFIDEASNQKLKRSILKENDILFSIAGIYLGKIGIVKKQHLPANTNQACAIIRLKHNEVDYRFIKLYFTEKSFVYYVNTLSGQAAQPNINLTDIGKLKLILPPLPTQQRIASILSAYDDLIEVNNQRIKLLEQSAREVYKEWFVRMRFPGYKQAKFKKGVPNWDVIKFGDIAVFSKGANPEELFENYIDGYKLYVNIEAIEGGKQTFCKDKKVVDVREGEVIMIMDGSRSGVVLKSREGALGSTLSVIRCRKEFENFDSYIFYFLKQNYEWIESNNVGSAIPHANRKFIERIHLLKPPDELIERFENTSKPMEKKIEILQQQNTQLRQIRDRLLPRLISGKLSLNHDSSDLYDDHDLKQSLKSQKSKKS